MLLALLKLLYSVFKSAVGAEELTRKVMLPSGMFFGIAPCPKNNPTCNVPHISRAKGGEGHKGSAFHGQAFRVEEMACFHSMCWSWGSFLEHGRKTFRALRTARQLRQSPEGRVSKPGISITHEIVLAPVPGSTYGLDVALRERPWPRPQPSNI